MMEYGDVMKEFKRMCWYYSRDKTQKTCPMCASYPNCNIGQCRKIAFERPAEFEQRVMEWAKENLEPVYTTWCEWLYDDFLRWCQTNYPGRAKDEKAWFDYLYETPIPADIAQKLGIEPKEG